VKTSIEADDEILKVHFRLRKKYKFLIEVDEEMFRDFPPGINFLVSLLMQALFTWT
jgi:hypothetical protein